MKAEHTVVAHSSLHLEAIMSEATSAAVPGAEPLLTAFVQSGNGCLRRTDAQQQGKAL